MFDDNWRGRIFLLVWPTSAAELVAAQEQLAAMWRPDWQPRDDPLFGGCYVCFEPAGERGWAVAALVQGAVVTVGDVVDGAANAPYEPGLLALREGPLLEAAVRALPRLPEVLIVNATGRDHPRRAGLALHLGAVLDLPTVGVTDRPLLGLDVGGETVATLVETRRGKRRLVAHAGWRTSVATAARIVLLAATAARTPQPIRVARQAARSARSAQISRS